MQTRKGGRRVSSGNDKKDCRQTPANGQVISYLNLNIPKIPVNLLVVAKIAYYNAKSRKYFAGLYFC